MRPPAGRTGSVDDLRNASFSRSALDAGEETLVRRVLDFDALEVPGPSRQSSSGADSGFSGTPATSPGFGRTPPDNALLPVIEEHSGMWIVESAAEPGVSPAASEGATPPAQPGRTSSHSSAVSWDSGLQEAGNYGIGPVAVAGDAGDARTRELFEPVSGPVRKDTGEVQHVGAAGEASVDGSIPGGGEPGPRLTGNP